MRPRSNPFPVLLDALAHGFLAGAAGGLLFLLIGLVERTADFLAYWPTQGFAGWLIARSLGLYPLLFGAAGAVLGVLLHVLRVLTRRRVNVFALVLGSMVAVTLLAYLTAWWQIDVLSGLPLEDPARRRGAILHTLLALAAGAAVAALAWWVGARRPGSRRRSAIVTLLLSGVLVFASDLGLATSGRASQPAASGAVERPARVAVIGLDGMTFRVLSPLLRAGEMPTFRRLIDHGAWGTYLTYGTASSPRVWTTMATGKKVRDHGIDDFVKAEGATYRAAPIRSSDRKVRALWNILSDFGRRVALVDWLITFPPEEVNGYVVSRLKLAPNNRTYPPPLRAEIAQLWPQRPQGEWPAMLWDIDRVFTTAEHLAAKESLDFLAVFDSTIDELEHRHWKHYKPASFDADLWGIEAEERTRYGHRIPDAYRHLDRKLGELMQRLPTDTLWLVVSDHGQLPAAKPRVRLRLDRILEILGYTRLAPATQAKGKDRVDYRQSRAYTLVETPWTPMLRVNLNLEGREAFGQVKPEAALAVADQLVADLRAIRVAGEPLFSQVVRARHPVREAGAGADIRVALSRQARDAASAASPLTIDDERFSLGELQTVDQTISGDHDHQGVIFAYGPGIEPGPIGQSVVPTAIHDLLWHLTDKVDAVDHLLPFFRRLGLIERASTLDLTPTVLYALGLPVARDMAGRPLHEIFSRPSQVEWIDSYETLPDPNAPDTEDDPSADEVLERLRALGYVD
ncbi:MAG: alkaline phosphatase family protein [Acidobacteriota bacterium]